MAYLHVHNNILQDDITRYKNIGVRTERKKKEHITEKYKRINQENKRAKIRGAEGKVLYKPGICGAKHAK